MAKILANYLFRLTSLTISVLVIVGWYLRIPEFVQIHSSLVPMQFNTALCFLLLSIGLMTMELKYWRYSIVLILCCLVLALFSGLQYLLDLSFGIDELLMSAYITVKTSHPGRMSPVTSICFVLASAGALQNFLWSRLTLPPGLKFLPTVCILYLSLTSLICYALGKSGIYIWQSYTHMAVHTSFCFLMLSIYFVRTELSRFSSRDKLNILYSTGVALAALFIFVLFSTLLDQNEKVTQRNFIANEVKALKHGINTSIVSRVEALERMAMRLGEGSYQSPEKFEKDVGLYVKHFKDIQAIEWIDSSNKIKWLFPLKGNEIVIDKILNQEAKRSLAQEKAKKEQVPVFSKIIDLIQGGQGVLLFVPVNKNGSAHGFLVTVFRLNNLLASLGGEDIGKFHLELSQEARRFIDTLPKDKVTGVDQGPFGIKITKYDLNWNLKLLENQSKMTDLSTFHPELILFLGLTVSYLIGILVFLNLQIVRKNKEIAKASKVKGEFLGNMSHEIRTPLHGILGLVELLSEKLESGDNRNNVEMIKRSAHSLLALVNDVLDFSKFESETYKVNNEAFKIKDVVEDTMNLYGQIALEKNLKFSSKIENNVPSVVSGDEVRIKQILANLVNNALKFTESGGVSLSVSLGPQLDNTQTVRFRVGDTGLGISNEAQEKIFKKFIQADSSTTRRFGGTGLGLSICKSLVEKMNGEIELKSEIGKGTQIDVVIPFGKFQSEIKEPIELLRLPKVTSSKNLRILIAEDNEINQIVIKGLLGKIGYGADMVSNGQEVLSTLESREYDLILMDCQMPILDGFEASKAIVNTYGDQRPLIVAITASALEEDRQKCLDSGMDFIISKPINLDELEKLLGRFASKPQSA